MTLTGDAKVGKSTILNRMNGSHFREEYELTIGVELGMIRNPEFPEFVLNVWDLAGQESFR